MKIFKFLALLMQLSTLLLTTYIGFALYKNKEDLKIYKAELATVSKKLDSMRYGSFIASYQKFISEATGVAVVNILSINKNMYFDHYILSSMCDLNSQENTDKCAILVKNFQKAKEEFIKIIIDTQESRELFISSINPNMTHEESLKQLAINIDTFLKNKKFEQIRYDLLSKLDTLKDFLDEQYIHASKNSMENASYSEKLETTKKTIISNEPWYIPSITKDKDRKKLAQSSEPEEKRIVIDENLGKSFN